MENETMMEIEVMDDAFNLEGAAAEEAATVAAEEPVADPDATVTEDQEAGCECETAEETECECTCSKKEALLKKCAEVKEACKNTAVRLKDNWKECGCNAYIRETTTYKVEIYKNREDTTPVDVYETEKSNGFSLKTVAIAGAAMLAVGCCVGKLAKLLK